MLVFFHYSILYYKIVHGALNTLRYNKKNTYKNLLLKMNGSTKCIRYVLILILSNFYKIFVWKSK